MTQTNDDLTVYDREPYANMLPMFAMFFQFGGPLGGPFFRPYFSPDLRGEDPTSTRKPESNQSTETSDCAFRIRAKTRILTTIMSFQGGTPP